MIVLQTLFAEGNKFAPVAGGGAAFGKPGDGCIPEHIFLAFHHAVDKGFEVFVALQRYRRFIIGERLYVRKPVRTAKFRVLPGSQQILPHSVLGLCRFGHPLFDGPKAQTGKSRYGRGEKFHRGKLN